MNPERREPPPPPCSSSVIHSRESSSSSFFSAKMSPSSADMGYHTMSLSGFSSPPLGNSSTSSSTFSVSKTNPFDSITDDLVLRILRHLSTDQLCLCSRTCRRFYFLAWDPSLWRKISLSSDVDGDEGLSTVLRLLARNSPSTSADVEVLAVTSPRVRITDSGIRTVSYRCPGLRRVELRCCRYITDRGIRELVNRCLSLTHLDLTGCSSVSIVETEKDRHRAIESSAILGVPNHDHHHRILYLRYLDLSDCTLFSDASLNNVIRNAPHLNFLYLRKCHYITDIGVKYLASFCLGLKEVSLCGCWQITDLALLELAKLGPSLRYLSVANCTNVTDLGLKRLAELCYKLRYLNIRGCEAVSDEAISTISKSCSRLKSLDIGKCDVTDAGLRALAENLPDIRKLSLKSCEMISDDGIRALSLQCHQLKRLNIQDCPVTIRGYRSIKKFCVGCIIEHTNPGFH